MATTVVLTKDMYVDGVFKDVGESISLEQYGDAKHYVDRGWATWGGVPVEDVDVFGSVLDEGLQVKAFDEVVDLTGNAAVFTALTNVVPAGARILSVQANVQGAVTGGSTTVKIGLGLHATDPDKYGITSVLTKNAKVNTLPAYAVLGADEQIDVCACATNGAAGDTALTVGSVRVRVVYLQPVSLKNV